MRNYFLNTFNVIMQYKDTYFSISNLKQHLLKKKTKQVASLYTSMLFGFFISFGVSVVNTRYLGPQHYGDLKFLQNLFNIFVTCLTFGYFTTGSTLLAKKNNDQLKHELFGNLIIVAVFTSIILIIMIYVFSYFEERIFSNDLGKIIRIFSPLVFVLLFYSFLQKLLTGDNRIYQLSIFNIAPPTLYLVCAIVFNYFIGLSLVAALAINFIIILVVVLLTCISLKPNFNNILKNLLYIWRENKSYGFQVYIGVLASVVTSQMANLWIAYYMDNVHVGFFSLALVITMPLTMIPNAVSDTFFKDYANNASISRRVILFTIGVSILALLVLFLIIDKLIIFVYSVEFSSVIPLVYIIALGSVIHGFGDLYTRFLGAHGQGKTMRNGAIVVGTINLIGYFLFVKYFGIKGAAIIKVISSLTYFYVRYFPYCRLVKTLKAM